MPVRRVVARPITVGLYNSYDPKSFHEAMRRAAARAGPLCDAFDLHLALFGFPFGAYETKAGERPDPRTPTDVARVLSEGTSIGQGGDHLRRLAERGHLHVFPFPDKGFPPQLGTPVLATRQADSSKRIDVHTLVERGRNEAMLVLVGLGPRGVPKKVHEACEHHIELTGSEVSLETATAMGVLVGRIAEARAKPETPRLTVDAVAVRDGRVLLIRRGRPPFAKAWALPGGFVDPGETTEAAVLRELEEETGVTGTVRALVGVYSDPGRDPRGPTVSISYLVDAGREEPASGDDAAAARYHEIAHLPDLAFDHGRILADALAKRDP